VRAETGWSRRFDDAIVLPDGRKLVTLLDAATYATKLPKKEADTAEWQAAIESLMLVAELGGPMMFARVGIMRALNRHVERVFDTSRKDHHWGRRKLARDPETSDTSLARPRNTVVDKREITFKFAATVYSLRHSFKDRLIAIEAPDSHWSLFLPCVHTWTHTSRPY
jgi:hypothetical protein